MENTFEKLVAPVKELNELALKSIEDITAIQLKAFQENSQAHVNSLKSASKVKDVESFQTYLTELSEVAQTLSNKAVEDAQKIVKLGESYTNGVREIVEKSIPVK